MNRRIPNGTYGGVRGRGRQLPLLLDLAGCVRHHSTLILPCSMGHLVSVYCLNGVSTAVEQDQ